MKAHLQNKDSEILWVENIPAHWDMWKVKFVSFYQNGAAFKSDLFRNDGDVFVIRIGDLVGSKVSLEDATTLTKENAEGFENVRLKKNDILLALTGATIGKSALFELDEECYLNQRVALFRPRKNILKEYLMLFIDSDVFRTHIDFECYGGAQENVGKSQILNAKLPLPPLPEQRQIAAYLDYKTKQIDRFIANRKKQIELLEEQKEAIINKAVTKGIDPKVKLKPSGVNWIGDIPEHWGTSKLTGVCRCVRGNSSFKKDELLSNGAYVALQYGKTYKVNEVDEYFEFYVNEEFYKDSQIVNNGDTIIISTSETIEDLGHSAFYNRLDLGLIGGEQMLLKPNSKKVHGKYLYYSSKVFRRELQKYGTGVKVFRFNIDELKSIHSSIPPIQEQKQISDYIDSELSERDELISKYQKQIDLMQEYKTSLISKAVTGKIDVREWQPKQTLKETV